MTDILGNIKVYTVIRFFYKPNREVEEKIHQHKHDYYQLVYATNDSGAIIIDGETVPMRENDVVIIRRDELHSFYVESVDFETYEIKFILVDEENDFLKNAPRYFCNDSDGTIRHSLRQIEREIDFADAVSRDMVSLEMCKILMLMQRKSTLTQQISEDNVKTDGNEVSDKQFDAIMKYIEENLDKGITVKDISDIACTEYKYFSHYFTLKYGVRLKQYIKNRRHIRAKDILVHTSKNMTEIANMCGYGSIQYFTRVFKKEENMSPTEFRRRFKNMYSVAFNEEPPSYMSGGEVIKGRHEITSKFVQKKK